MSNLYWLTEDQMVRLRSYFPKSRGKPRVDDRRVLSGIIFINRNGYAGVMRPLRMGHPRRFIIAGNVGAMRVYSLG